MNLPLNKWLSVCLIVNTLLSPCLKSAQVSAPRASSRLKIIPLEGKDAINHIPTRSATAPVIEVRDENDRLVEGALVTFEITATGGAGATFSNGKIKHESISDYRGQAGVDGYTMNGVAGSFSIKITATHGERSGALFMSQTNSMKTAEALQSDQKRSRRKKWWIIGIAAAAAGAAAGVYLATRNGSDPVSVSTGPVVIGPR